MNHIAEAASATAADEEMAAGGPVVGHEVATEAAIEFEAGIATENEPEAATGTATAATDAEVGIEIDAANATAPGAHAASSCGTETEEVLLAAAGVTISAAAGYIHRLAPMLVLLLDACAAPAMADVEDAVVLPAVAAIVSRKPAIGATLAAGAPASRGPRDPWANTVFAAVPRSRLARAVAVAVARVALVRGSACPQLAREQAPQRQERVL